MKMFLDKKHSCYPPKSTPRTKGEPATSVMRCGGPFAGGVTGLLVYFFFPLALATALAFGTSLGAGTLPFGFIDSFQLLETLKPIR